MCGVPILPSARLWPCLLTPSLPLGQAEVCLLAYSLDCGDKVSNQLGAGSGRSGAGEGQSRGGAERQVRRLALGSSHGGDGRDRVT